VAERNGARIPASCDQGKMSKIFIIDDDEGARDSLRLLLQCEGLEARESGFLRGVSPCCSAAGGNCLILDVDTPGTSGLELLENSAPQRRRAHPTHRRGAAQPVGVVHVLVAGQARCLGASKAARFVWCCQTPSSIATARATRDLPLPRPVREVILASKPSASRQMPVDSRARCGTRMSQGYSA